MILTLSIILFLLIIIIGKKRGFKAFISIYLNYFLIILSAILICIGINPIIISLLFSIGISAFILFFINGINIKTKIAFLSVSTIVVLISFLIVFVVYSGNFNGFSIENGEILFVYNNNIDIDFNNISIAVIIISLTGVITDSALDMATSLNEIYQNNKHLTFKELLNSGKNMGGDILRTMINTLFFVFIGEFMGFFFLYYDASFLTIINHKFFAQEVSQLIIGSLGCVLIIPTVILTQSFIYTKKKKLK